MILAIDIGLANCGWAVIGRDGKVINCGVISTKKTKGINNTLDHWGRMLGLRTALSNILQTYVGVTHIAVEAISWPRNASATSKIGMAWGVVSSICGHLKFIPIAPVEAKKFLTGNRKASKEEMIDEVIKRLPLQNNFLLKIRKTKREHAADAVAVGLTAQSKLCP